MKSRFLLYQSLWSGLLWLLFVGSVRAGGPPPDSIRLQQTRLPDTTRLRLLEALSRGYGPSSPPRCINFAARGLPLAQRLRKGDVELGLLDNIAVSYARMGDMPAATRYCLRELQRARQLGNRRYEIDALLAMANIESNEQNSADAEATARQALTLAESYGVPLSLARAQNQLGNFCLSRQRFEESERLLKAALPVFQQLGRVYEQGDCLAGLAEIAVKRRQYDPAITYGRQAVALMRQKGDSYGSAWALVMLGRAAIGQRDLVAARRYGEEALQEARAAQLPSIEIDLMSSLVDTYVKQRDFPEAYELQHRITFLKDSIYRQERAEEMARLQTQFETEKKRQQIERLTARNRIEALEKARVRTRLWWASGAALALMLVLGVLTLILRRLRRSEQALRQSNTTKDQLMSILGHDLRGPVAAFQQVAGMVRFYAQNPSQPDELRLADQIERSTTNLAGLLDNMLHWARAQSGSVVNRPTALVPAEVVDRVVGLYQSAAAFKKQELRSQVDAGCSVVWADAALLDTVLRNLVSNAIKFTPKEGQVEILVQPAATGVGFKVCDTGVGLSAEALAHLFDPIVSPTRGTSGEAGTGLGVAVCRQFVALLGGELRVNSQPGIGTEFWFVLPKNAETAADSRGN